MKNLAPLCFDPSAHVRALLGGWLMRGGELNFAAHANDLLSLRKRGLRKGRKPFSGILARYQEVSDAGGLGGCEQFR